MSSMFTTFILVGHGTALLCVCTCMLIGHPASISRGWDAQSSLPWRWLPTHTKGRHAASWMTDSHACKVFLTSTLDEQQQQPMQCGLRHVGWASHKHTHTHTYSFDFEGRMIRVLLCAMLPRSGNKTAAAQRMTLFSMHGPHPSLLGQNQKVKNFRMHAHCITHDSADLNSFFHTYLTSCKWMVTCRSICQTDSPQRVLQGWCSLLGKRQSIRCPLNLNRHQHVTTTYEMVKEDSKEKSWTIALLPSLLPERESRLWQQVLLQKKRVLRVVCANEDLDTKKVDYFQKWVTSKSKLLSKVSHFKKWVMKGWPSKVSCQKLVTPNVGHTKCWSSKKVDHQKVSYSQKWVISKSGLLSIVSHSWLAIKTGSLAKLIIEKR